MVALEFEDGDRDKDALGAVFGSEDEEEEDEEEVDEEEEGETGDVEIDCPPEFPTTLFESSFVLLDVAIVEAEASEPPTADTLLDEFARATLSFSFLSPPTSMDKDDELASVSFFSNLKNGCVSNNERGEGREAGFTDRHLRTRS